MRPVTISEALKSLIGNARGISFFESFASVANQGETLKVSEVLSCLHHNKKRMKITVKNEKGLLTLVLPTACTLRCLHLIVNVIRKELESRNVIRARPRGNALESLQQYCSNR